MRTLSAAFELKTNLLEIGNQLADFARHERLWKMPR